MKEHPRLFSAPMALAASRGLKTQTRRVITPHNSFIDGYPAKKDFWARLDFSKAWTDPGPSPGGWPGPYLQVPNTDGDTIHRVYSRINPGDLIWGREAWRACQSKDQLAPSKIPRGSPVTFEAGGHGFSMFPLMTPGKLRPSMFMPRWACRLELDVTAVKPERLLDIGEADALAEGITCENVIIGTYYAGGHCEETADRFLFEGCPDEGYETADDAYMALWDSINGEGEAAKNPLVWAYTFTRRTQ